MNRLFLLHPLIHLGLLLVVMAICSAVTSLLNMLVAPLLGFSREVLASGGSIYDPSLSRFVMLTMSAAQFIVPSLILAWFLVQTRALVYLGLARRPYMSSLLQTVLAVVVGMPFIALTAQAGSLLPLPESMLQEERSIMEMQLNVLSVDSTPTMLLNLLVVAFIPALGEELFFRGIVQRTLGGWMRNMPMAIFLTAILFSAAHFQPTGFISRFLLAAAFGYIYWWSGSLWLSIAAHFTNNAIPVLCYFYFSRDVMQADTATISLGWQMLVGFVSLLLALQLLAPIKRRGRWKRHIKLKGAQLL